MLNGGRNWDIRSSFIIQGEKAGEPSIQMVLSFCTYINFRKWFQSPDAKIQPASSLSPHSIPSHSLAPAFLDKGKKENREQEQSRQLKLLWKQFPDRPVHAPDQAGGTDT